MSADSTTFERHYRVGELAKLWSLGRETVRKLVKDDPGVIKIRMGRKKAHTVYSVPRVRRATHPHQALEFELTYGQSPAAVDRDNSWFGLVIKSFLQNLR